MRTIKVNGHTLEMWDGVDSLPAANYINHSRLAMLDAGIGSDLDAVTRHWQSIAMLAERGDKEGLNATLSNYMQTLAFIVSNTSPEMMSFVSFIRTMNGKVLEDYSDDNAKAVIEQLSKAGLTMRIVRDFLSFVKKKSKPNLKRTALQVA